MRIQEAGYKMQDAGYLEFCVLNLCLSAFERNWRNSILHNLDRVRLYDV